MKITDLGPDFVLPLAIVLSYVAGMGLKAQSAGGLAGPGIEAPPPSAYALELQQRAASRAPADLQQVAQGLTTEQGLHQLNSPQDYDQLPAQSLAIQPVLVRLASNKAPGVPELIGNLCVSPVFLARESRVECLLQVLPSVRPTPPQAIDLLRKQTEPASEHLDLAIRTLFEIGSPPALAIFATQAANPRQDFVQVQGWMRDPLLRHRRDPAVLEMCLDLLKKQEFDAERKNALVEALFDYRPRDWYLSPEAGASPPPKPPPANQASAEAKKLLKAVAALLAKDPAISLPNKRLAERGK